MGLEAKIWTSRLGLGLKVGIFTSRLENELQRGWMEEKKKEKFHQSITKSFRVICSCPPVRNQGLVRLRQLGSLFTSQSRVTSIWSVGWEGNLSKCTCSMQLGWPNAQTAITCPMLPPPIRPTQYNGNRKTNHLVSSQITCYKHMVH